MILLQMKSVFMFARRLRRAFNYPQLMKAAPAQKSVHSDVAVGTLFATSFCNFLQFAN
jgi:hypothetical protein